MVEYPISSVYYLHPNENPALVLVQPVLDNKNYHAWARSFKMALLSKNKDGFIDGSIVVPNPSNKDYPAWKQCNNMVIRWIMNSVSPPIAHSIMWMDVAEDVWKDLADRYSNGNVFKLFDLLEEMYTMKQGDLSINEYYTKLKIIWEELMILRPIPSCTCDPKCRCGAAQTAKKSFEADCVISFLKGLNDNFYTLKSQVPLMANLPSISKVFSMALKCETQLNHGIEQPIAHDSAALAARGMYVGGEQPEVNSVQNRPFGSFGRGNTGNSYVAQGYSKNGANQGAPSGLNKRYQCTFCGRSGHSVERCYQKHGFPPSFKNKGRIDARANQAFVDQDGTTRMMQDEIQVEYSAAQINQAMQILKVLQSTQSQAVAQDQGQPVEQATVLSANFSGSANEVGGHCITEDDWIS